ncbi:MAG: bifunctional riboflavin kinase/FAD synthetase [Bacteroidales bacterium]|jgi:riboflavin kinase/FMN adenylyltransferase|nr:bifunctional riboflavin kinase/FAD synthetase [Bacteroidales bacterium]
MKIYQISDKPYIINPVVTIGIFDGVHKGHKYILQSLISKAKESGGKSVVITLWPHPRIVLNKDMWNFRLLHSQEEKIHHLSKLGLDYYITIPFTKELASTNACDFVKEYLVEQLNVSRLLLGYDNSFGKDHHGSTSGIAACARKSGLIVERLDEFKVFDENISSTSVRNALLNGNLELARTMLDYDYYLEGQVVMGNQLGRKLGYPTANVHPQSAYKLIPKNGVYAVHVEFENVLYPAMLNIGYRPTLDSANPVKIIEAHIFDFDIDLYDKDIIIHFRKRIRDEHKFSNLDGLKRQLQADELEIRAYLSGN